MSKIDKHVRTKAEREQDLILLAELYTQNLTYREIAKSISGQRPYSITFQQVSYDVKKMIAEWKEKHTEKIDLYMIEQLQKLDMAEREYWQAWERSKEDFKKTATKGKGKAGSEKPSYQEKSITTEDRNGNPAYLAGVERCIKQRCELLGLLKQKVEHSGVIDSNPQPKVYLKIVRKNGC